MIVRPPLSKKWGGPSPPSPPLGTPMCGVIQFGHNFGERYIFPLYFISKYLATRIYSPKACYITTHIFICSNACSPTGIFHHLYVFPHDLLFSKLNKPFILCLEIGWYPLELRIDQVTEGHLPLLHPSTRRGYNK